MAYDSLIDWTGSDTSTDLMMLVFGSILIELEAGFATETEVADECNTSGAVNVALAIEAGVFNPFPLNWFEKADLAFFERVKKGLQKEVKSSVSQKEWNSAQEKREHVQGFKRMEKNVDRFVKMIRKAAK